VSDLSGESDEVERGLIGKSVVVLVRVAGVFPENDLSEAYDRLSKGWCGTVLRRGASARLGGVGTSAAHERAAAVVGFAKRSREYGRRRDPIRQGGCNKA
jgi:hypothetical protein